MRPTILCRLFRLYLRLTRRPLLSNEAVFERAVQRMRRHPPLALPRVALSLPSLPCATYFFPQPPPRAGQAAPGCTVLYLYGSAYVAPPQTLHLRFAEFLRERLGANVVFPLYPLAPEQHGETAILAVEKVYAEACRIAKGGPVCVAGSSAGGALALALCQRLCCGGTARWARNDNHQHSRRALLLPGTQGPPAPRSPPPPQRLARRIHDQSRHPRRCKA